MCGIAGIIAWDQRQTPSRALLSAMSQSLAHRGPDGQGLWQSPPDDGPQAGLVHRRLAIIDLDHRADQPLTDGQGRWIVFNGEIYNYRELRRELESADPHYPWKTSSDTEVLLRAYAQWGTDCLRRISGMLAVAIWDAGKGELFLARDRMGQKPLYYAVLEGGAGQAPAAVAFASQLQVLRQVPWVKADLDEASLHEYLSWGYISAPRTIYRDVGHLPPATWLVFGGSRQEGRYFDPNEPAAQATPADPVASARRLVLQAVRRQMVADVPVGCFLSGGVDSSVVAAAMKAAAAPGQQVLSFSIGFDDPRYDETPYAARVASHLGTQHRQFIVRPDAAADLPRLAAAFGEPFADSSSLPTHYLAQQTRQHVKAALSGDGGDELFGGYDRYRALRLSQRLQQAMGPLSRVVSALRHLLPGHHPKSTSARLRRLLADLGRPGPQRYSGYMRLFDPALIARLAPGLAGGPDMLAQQFEKLATGRQLVPAALAVDRMTYLPGDLLTKVDRASMLHALEVRAPFMDEDLVGFAAGLSTPQLIDGGPKRLLRQAFAGDLPPWVFTRPKMGFAVPVGQWFRGELQSMLREHLFSTRGLAAGRFDMSVVRQMVERHQAGQADHSQRLYALLMLELWHAWQAGA
jgi:asparagine synthase (glutamine-hydrolysing)